LKTTTLNQTPKIERANLGQCAPNLHVRTGKKKNQGKAREKEGNCLARAEGMIGDAIWGKGIQAGTEDAKVMRGEDGVHDNYHNWLTIGRGRRRKSVEE